MDNSSQNVKAGKSRNSTIPEMMEVKEGALQTIDFK